MHAHCSWFLNLEMSILFFRDKTIDETHPPRRAHSQQGPERLELPMLSEGRMQRAYSQEAEVPIVLQPLTSPHGGGKTRVKSYLTTIGGRWYFW